MTRSARTVTAASAAALTSLAVAMLSAGAAGPGASVPGATTACRRSSRRTARGWPYTSTGARLVAGDTNGRADAFVRDASTGTTTMTSEGFDGDVANGASGMTSLSRSGRHAVFTSVATDVVPGSTTTNADESERRRGPSRLRPCGHGRLPGQRAIPTRTSSTPCHR